MFLGTITQTTSVADTNIPITTVMNTNRKVVNNTTSNVLDIRKQGIYNIDGWLELYGATGDVDVNIVADGNILRSETVTLATATTYVVVPIADAVKCVLASYPQVANISIQVGTSGLTLSGLIRVEYLQ